MTTGEDGGSEGDSRFSVEVAIANGRGERRRRRKAISEGSRYATRSQSRERFASDLGDMLRDSVDGQPSTPNCQLSQEVE